MSGGESWREALRFLNDFAVSTGPHARMFLPGVRRVQVVNRGRGGWVRLDFYGYSLADATDLATRLLLPDPEPVDARDADFAFEGIPSNEPPDGDGAAVRLRPSPKLPTLAAHHDLPGAIE
ncbi:hypothetical protein [Cryptosporangium phraense]|uniref:Uncharacterized protein n=1 Tax=Cryptosporangium phraense TaxID=2593070 RepID=A0A545AZV8_9ACTN|nr:hypothetical protein [Cryptosporangium phraense]TQS46860.1 hypothetical protein FL583_00855 [Cryptosporangium phraense]